jgi:hypothetical protein
MITIFNCMTADLSMWPIAMLLPLWPEWSRDVEQPGPQQAARFHDMVTFREGRAYRLIPTRANRQPAFGSYTKDPYARQLHADGLMVLTLAGERISAPTRFDNSVLPSFGLPRTLPS